MRFVVVFTLGLVICLGFPRAGSAQLLDPDWESRSALIPILGYSMSYSQVMEISERDLEWDEVEHSRKETRMGSGMVAGIRVEHRPMERITLGATVLNSSLNWRLDPIEGTERFLYKGQVDEYPIDSNKTWIFKASTTVHVDIPFPVGISVGPGMIWTFPRHTRGLPAEMKHPHTHWSLTYGIETNVPIWGDRKVRVAVENHLVFWDDEDTARRIDSLNYTRPPQGQDPRSTLTTVESELFSIPTIQLGLRMPF